MPSNSDMQLEPNLFFVKTFKDDEDNTLKVDARGYHDPVAKCFYIKAGSMITLCSNPRSKFFSIPELQKMYEDTVLSSITSAGDDIHCYLTRDIRCYPIDKNDELTVAASLVRGLLTTGSTSWRNAEGVSVRKMSSSKTVLGSVDEQTLNTLRYEEAAELTFNMISAKRALFILILSYAHYMANALGNKNEDRFVVPRQVDHCMKKFNFICEEVAAYDLVIAETDYTISDKMGNFLFHQEKSLKPRKDNIKSGLMMSNIRSGQSSDNIQRPQFDCLLAIQHKPFLVCGIAPYSKIVQYFKIEDGGTVLTKVPIDNFRYVISPTERVEPVQIPEDAAKEIDAFAAAIKGGFLPDLIDKSSLLDSTLKIEDNTTPTELW